MSWLSEHDDDAAWRQAVLGENWSDEARKAAADAKKRKGGIAGAGLSGGPIKAAPLKRGASGPLGTAHKPKGGEADARKLRQLRSDAATAQGNYESAKKAGLMSPAELGKLAAAASAWKGKADAFEKEARYLAKRQEISRKAKRDGDYKVSRGQ